MPHLPAAGGGGSGASIGGAVTGATDGSVLFVGAGGVLAQDNANLFYDVTDAQLVMGAGTVTKPSIIFGDDGTGIYRPALNQMAWSLAGVSAMRLGAVGPDSDQTLAMGRCLIDSRITDEVCISHRDMTASGQQGLRLSALGLTTLNSATGLAVNMSINNSTRWRVNGTAFQFEPGTDNTVDLGATTQRVRRQFLAEFLEMSEQTAPAAPAANKLRLYGEDNGAGKTRLMAIFPTGAAVQIAIEP